MRTQDTFFTEEQRFRQPWLWAVLAVVVGVEIAVGRHVPWPALAAMMLACAGLITLMLVLRLHTEVRSDGLHLRFDPFTSWDIPFEQLVRFEARQYSPIREFGGWGLRWGFSGRAWNVSGDRGVQLVLRDGTKLLVGSQRADELARALYEAQQLG